MYLAEEHCLKPGTARESIRSVMSHSHLLLQSEQYLSRLEEENGRHSIFRQCTLDSAGACRLVDTPLRAAARAGLEVAGSKNPVKLADLESETRYIVLCLQPAPITNRLGLRFSVFFMLRNQEGALLSVQVALVLCLPEPEHHQDQHPTTHQ